MYKPLPWGRERKSKYYFTDFQIFFKRNHTGTIFACTSMYFKRD